MGSWWVGPGLQWGIPKCAMCCGELGMPKTTLLTLTPLTQDRLGLPLCSQSILEPRGFQLSDHSILSS